MHYALIKDNVVVDLIAFEKENESLINFIIQERNCDSAVVVEDDKIPYRYSTYDGKTFTMPTDEYLISIGVLDPNYKKTITE